MRPTGCVRVLLAVIAVAYGQPGGMAATDRSSAGDASLAPEPGTVRLPGATAGVAVVEPASGAAAVIRLVATGDSGAGLGVEVWAEEGGTWSRRGTAAPAARASDPLRLLTVRDGDGPIAVVVSSRRSAADCCTTLRAIRVGERGLRLETVAERLPPVDAALAVDLDADGVDELVLSGAPASADSAGRLFVLRRGSAGYATAATLPIPEGMREPPFVLGESDGLAGDEVGLIDRAGTGRIARLSWHPGAEPAIELARLFAPRDPRQDITGVLTLPTGQLAVVSTGSTYRADWAAGEEPRVSAGGSAGGVVLGVLGSEAAFRIVLLDVISGRIRVVDEDLRQIERLDAPPGSLTGAWLPQYGGPLVGTGTPTAALAYGTTIGLDGQALTMNPAASFGGTHPIATIGTDRRWMVLLRSLDGHPMSAAGGELRPPQVWADDRLSIAPTSVSLSRQPEREASAWLTLDGAAPAPQPDDRADTLALVAESGGYRVGVRAPPGTLVHVGGAAGGGSNRLATIEATSAVTWVDVPSPVEIGDQALVAVVTPSGRSYTARLAVGRVLDGPPALEAETSTVLLAPMARIEGRTDEGTTVTIDGVPISVSADGVFAQVVTAGPIPRQLRVEATDPIGNRSSVTLTAVGFVDYLAVPWAGIGTAALLVAVAIRGWRRPPRARADHGLVQDVGAAPPEELAAILRGDEQSRRG